MNVLFYTPVNFRCRDIESLAKKYAKDGHQVFLLSQCEPGPLHQSFYNMAMPASAVSMTRKNDFIRLIYHVLELLRFCRRNKIDILFSHLEPTNFVSVLAQYFIKAKVIIYRHHVDLARLLGFDRSLTYRLTYRLARHIIAVSEEAKDYMVLQERVSIKKISQINLGYDFLLYDAPDELEITKIKRLYRADVLLVTAGSLSRYKRPELAIQLVKKLQEDRLNGVLLLLGKGEEYDSLRLRVKDLDLEDRIFFLGHVPNIMSYLHAADWLIHPSVSEASCVVVKEAALACLPVMVCRKVGDFDKYMRHNINSVVLDPESFVRDAAQQLIRYKADASFYKQMAMALRNEIVKRFSIENIYKQYATFTD